MAILQTTKKIAVVGGTGKSLSGKAGPFEFQSQSNLTRNRQSGEFSGYLIGSKPIIRRGCPLARCPEV